MTDDCVSLVALLRTMLEKDPEWEPGMDEDLLTWEMHGQRLSIWVSTDPSEPPYIELRPTLQPPEP